MGGEQAAGVLATLRRDALARAGGQLNAEDDETIQAAVLSPIHV